MKIKVGDLTIREKYNLCKKSVCKECPLYVGDIGPFGPRRKCVLLDICAAGHKECYDMVVDFPEDCIDWNTRLPQGIKDTVVNLMDFDKEQK